MQIKIYVTRYDLLKANLFAAPRIGTNWLVLAIVYLLVGLLLMSGEGFTWDGQTALVLLITSLVLFLFVATGTSMIMLIRVYLLGRYGDGVLGAHEITLREDGMFEKTDLNESFTKWQGVWNLWRSRTLIMIRVGRYVFHVIPRRDFPDTAAEEAFWNKLQTSWREALNSKAAP